MQVKDYVFSHLHDVIHVSDMAKELGVNPDYLSHLFSESEKITITDYIRWEKVRRGKNLLKYSEYKIQDIALSGILFPEPFFQGVSETDRHRTRRIQEKIWKSKKMEN